MTTLAANKPYRNEDGGFSSDRNEYREIVFGKFSPLVDCIVVINKYSGMGMCGGLFNCCFIGDDSDLWYSIGNIEG